jgi:hypothetical protein
MLTAKGVEFLGKRGAGLNEAERTPPYLPHHSPAARPAEPRWSKSRGNTTGGLYGQAARRSA